MYYISGQEMQEREVFSGVDMGVVKTDKKDVVGRFCDMWNHALRNGKNLNKVMIAVKTIDEAIELNKYLSGVWNRTVGFSTSENDKDSKIIKEFKAGRLDALIVVNRGILGFSDNYVTGMFDLRCSQNPEVANQLFARVLRVHPEDVFKFYYRFASSKNFNREVINLHKIKALLRRDIFTTYNGKNMNVEIR